MWSQTALQCAWLSRCWGDARDTPALTQSATLPLNTGVMIVSSALGPRRDTHGPRSRYRSDSGLFKAMEILLPWRTGPRQSLFLQRVQESADAPGVGTEIAFAFP